MVMLGGGTAFWLFAFVALQALTVPATVERSRKWPPLVVACVTLGLVAADGMVAPITAVAALAVLFVLLVVAHERRAIT
jgi:Ca2+/Na+ antiporter